MPARYSDEGTCIELHSDAMAEPAQIYELTGKNVWKLTEDWLLVGWFLRQENEVWDPPSMDSDFCTRTRSGFLGIEALLGILGTSFKYLPSIGLCLQGPRRMLNDHSLRVPPALATGKPASVPILSVARRLDILRLQAQTHNAMALGGEPDSRNGGSIPLGLWVS